MIRPIITGRGCPYNCSFCFNKAYSELYAGGVRTRQRSVSRVIEEIKSLRDAHGLKFVLFMDDTFIVNAKWLREFSAQYRAEVGIPWWCQVRADLVNEEKMGLLKDAGCVSVSFGIEAGDEYLRNVILNRKMSDEQILGAAQLIREHGIAFSTNNMLGLPKGGLETDFETLELNIAAGPITPTSSFTNPTPKRNLARWHFGRVHGRLVRRSQWIGQ